MKINKYRYLIFDNNQYAKYYWDCFVHVVRIATDYQDLFVKSFFFKIKLTLKKHT